MGAPLEKSHAPLFGCVKLFQQADQSMSIARGRLENRR